MSSRYVREKFREWVTLFATPFYETVNTEQAPQESYWCTLDFSSAAASRMDLCGDTEETGTVDVWFFGPPGEGDAELLTRAENDMQVLVSQIDTRLAITNCQPPGDTRGEKDEQAFFFGVDYLYYH